MSIIKIREIKKQCLNSSRSNSKPSLLVPDKGRQESKGWQDGKVRRGREPSPGAIRRIGGSSVTSTLYL